MLKHIIVIALFLYTASTSYAKSNFSSSNKESSTKERIKTDEADKHIFQQNYIKEEKFGLLTIVNKKQDNLINNGPSYITNSSIKQQAKINGFLEISNSKINELIQNGSLDATNSEFNLCTINGNVKLKNVKIANKLIVTGAMNINNSIIAEINADSQNISLNNTIIHDLNIKSNNNRFAYPKIIINGTTAISGNINFIGNQGIIEIYGNDCSINQYSNARVIYK